MEVKPVILDEWHPCNQCGGTGDGSRLTFAWVHGTLKLDLCESCATKLAEQLPQPVSPGTIPPNHVAVPIIHKQDEDGHHVVVLLPGNKITQLSRHESPQSAQAAMETHLQMVKREAATELPTIPPEVAAAVEEAVRKIRQAADAATYSPAVHGPLTTALNMLTFQVLAALQAQAAPRRWTAEEIDSAVMAELIDEHGFDIPRAGAVSLGVMQWLRGQAAPLDKLGQKIADHFATVTDADFLQSMEQAGFTAGQAAPGQGVDENALAWAVVESGEVFAKPKFVSLDGKTQEWELDALTPKGISALNNYDLWGIVYNNPRDAYVAAGIALGLCPSGKGE